MDRIYERTLLVTTSPFELEASLFGEVYNSGSFDAHLKLELILPAGFTFTSDSGVFPGAGGSIETQPGHLKRELYKNIPGLLVTDLTTSPAFPDSPSVVESIPLFESKNLGDYYGERLSGYLKPPVSGNYVFYLASDDQGELWLSTDRQRGNKRLIVSEPVWNLERNWLGQNAPWDSSIYLPGRASASIALEAGKYYYIEALHKDHEWGDHIAVAWQMPGGSPPANGSDPIPGQYIYWDVPNETQTITFGPLPDGTYGDAPFALTATASSGLPVSFESLTPEVIQISSNIVTIVGTGTAAIRASQSGNEIYPAAPEVEQSFNVAKADLVVTGNEVTKVYGTENPLLTGTISGLVEGDNILASYSTTATKMSDAGVYTVYVNLSDPDGKLENYNVSVLFGALRIARAPQIITFGEIPPHVYGDEPFVIPVSASSGLPVTLTSSVQSVATMEGNTLTILGVGTTQLTAYQFGNHNYLPAEFVKYFLIVGKGTPVITWSNPSEINCQTVLGTAQLNATSSVPGTFTYNPPAGSTLPLGDGQILSVTFAPNDSANYRPVQATTTINVRLNGGLAARWETATPNTSLATLSLAPGGQVATVGYSWANGIDFSVSKYSVADGSVIWQKIYNSPGNGYDEGKAGAVDSGGNVAVTGLSAVGSGNQDYLTARYAAADGTLLWLQRYNGPANGDDQSRAVAVDAAGNVLVTGNSWNGSNWDIATLKYAAAGGTVLWEQRYNGPSNGQDYGTTIAVDSAGDVIVSGSSASDYYTAKYASANGALLWERRYSRGDDQVMSMTLDNQDNVIVTGFSSGSGVGYDFYTAKYAAVDGALIWDKHYNSVTNRDEFGGDVKVDAAGNVVVAGHASNGSTSDYLLAKYTAQDGTLLWEKRVPNQLGFLEGRTALAVDAQGNTVFTGLIRHSDDSRETYTASYSSADGRIFWEHRSPTTGNVPRPVVVNDDGDVITTGNLSLLLLRNGTKPLVSLVGEATITIEPGVFADPGATAVDGCGNSLPVTRTDSMELFGGGTYTLTYVATDAVGQSARVNRTLIVRNLDHPPVAVLGQDLTLVAASHCEARYYFDASRSYDSDGDALEFQWQVTFESASGKTSIFKLLPDQQYIDLWPETYTVKLTVSSTRSGVSSSSSVTQTVTVLSGAPIIETISPSTAYVGGPTFNLTVWGGGFCLDGAKINWNGMERPTVWISSNQLVAAIPASDLNTELDISVATIQIVAADGQVSNPFAFSILADTVGAVDASVAEPGETVSVTTAPAADGTSGVAVVAENNGGGALTVLAATYDSPPTSGDVFEVADGSCVDVQIIGADETDRAVVAFYYPTTVVNEEELKLRYYDGTSWKEVRSSGGATPLKDITDNLNGTVSGGRFTVIFDATSIPKITQLTGTIFGMFNPVPQIYSLTGPAAPLSVGSHAMINISYATSVNGQNCEISFDWNDGTTTTSLNSDNGIASAQHAFTSPGVYKVDVTVNDPTTGSTSRDFSYVVVYDPNGGFVTGGGWINSPSGALRSNPELVGEARFGFVSKYKKGSSSPVGQTEFQFALASFGFQSTSYQWLVVSGGKAQFKGLGRVNGVGEFGFLLTATDSDKYSGGPDKFRIKIWNVATESIVYDNAFNEPDSLEGGRPQEISGGSIVIHKQ